MASHARPARAADAEVLGDIHVRAWQAAYRGVMPDAYLDALRPADRADLWRASIEAARPDRAVWMVTDDLGEVAGFAAFGPEAGEPPLPGVGELYAINLDPDRWGRGLGRLLLAAVHDQLRGRRHTSAVLPSCVALVRGERTEKHAVTILQGHCRLQRKSLASAMPCP